MQWAESAMEAYKYKHQLICLIAIAIREMIAELWIRISAEMNSNFYYSNSCDQNDQLFLKH